MFARRLLDDCSIV